MYESDAQKRVSKAVVKQNAESLTAGLTDNGNAVIIQAAGHDAAYTAEEAREFARSLEITSGQRWERTATEAVEYIRLLADVVDGIEDEEAIEEWEFMNLEP